MKTDRKAYRKKYYQEHIEQDKEYRKKYYLAHREEMMAADRRWYLKHSEELKIKGKAYRREHIKQIKERSRKYYLAHREQVLERTRKWAQKHPEKTRLAGKKWRLTHPEKSKELTKKWRLAHLEHCKKRIKQYYKTPTFKILTRKYNANRRKFGFVPLNKPFEGSQGHHIDESGVIYMPEEMHQSIYHSVLQNRNMREINKLAFLWLEVEELYTQVNRDII